MLLGPAINFLRIPTGGQYPHEYLSEDPLLCSCCRLHIQKVFRISVVLSRTDTMLATIRRTTG
jgi:hypothetical protein